MLNSRMNVCKNGKKCPDYKSQYTSICGSGCPIDVMVNKCVTIQGNIITEISTQKNSFPQLGKLTASPFRGAGKYWWCKAVNFEENKQKLPQYCMTFRCDDYRRYAAHRELGIDVTSFPLFNKSQPHDIYSIGEIQFAELVRWYKGEACATPSIRYYVNRKHYEIIFPGEIRNIANRPGFVWPLMDLGIDQRERIDSVGHDIFKINGKGTEFLNNIEKYNNSYFHVDDVVTNSALIQSVTRLFLDWVTAVEEFRQLEALS